MAADSAAEVAAGSAEVAVDSAAAVVAVADGSECQCQEGTSARRGPNDRRAPALPSVKSHNAQGPHAPGGVINLEAVGEPVDGSDGGTVPFEGACPKPYKLAPGLG